MSDELQARILGMPRIENGEIVFEVRVDTGGSAPDIVRATSRAPGAIAIPFFGLSKRTVSAARAEVVRWTKERRHLMESLYTRLRTDRRRRVIQSQMTHRSTAGRGETTVAEVKQGKESCTLEEHTGHAVPVARLSAELERLGAVVGERAATIRERSKSSLAPASEDLEMRRSLRRK